MRYSPLLVLAFVACSAPAPSPVALREAPIVNGTLDQGHPSVGIVFNGGSNGGCTGTLIAPDKVLTAAHCVFASAPPHQFNEQIYFFLGDEPRLHYAAIGVTVHPDYDGVQTGDVALIWLAQAIGSVTPAPLAISPLSSGEAITLVGYGITSHAASDFGDKREGPQTVDEMGDQWFSFDCQNGAKPCICGGDSGGPTFFSSGSVEQIAGVHSGSSQDCTGFGYDMRVDIFAPWIAGASMGIALYRAPCSQDADCHSDLCVLSSDGQRYCSQSCSASELCPYLDQCVSDACVPHTGGDGALGEGCAWGLDCVSGRCLVLPAPLQGSACSQECDLLAQDCPDHYECRDIDAGWLCVPTGNIPRPDSGGAVTDGGLPMNDGATGDAPSATEDATIGAENSAPPGDSGGCHVGGQGGAFGLWALLLVTLLRRRRCGR